jgi:release factor glutamine methyltransferase
VNSRSSDPPRQDASASDGVVERLRAAGCVFAEDEAVLLREASGGDPMLLESMVARREGGEPLEVLVGWAEFRGMRIAVASGVFVPRRRTGVLVTQALPFAKPGTIAVELCAGVAAVAAALIAEAPGVEVWAAEIDPVAVEVARRNVDPFRVVEGDLYAPLPAGLRGRVGILIANAPYVPTDEIALMPAEARDHEPLVALDGGADGLDIQRRVIAGAAEWLAPGGVLLIETSERQAPATVALMRRAGLTARAVHDDEVDGTAAVGVV